MEANDALIHDVMWSSGAVSFVGLFILLKTRNIFIFFMALLGLLLSFPSAYYFYYAHFYMKQMSIIHATALFIMLGIGADDIFLMIDTYRLTKVFMGPNAKPGDVMKVAYRKAGGMMLVTSITASFCFYSNAFNVLFILKQFGIYMGTG